MNIESRTMRRFVGGLLFVAACAAHGGELREKNLDWDRTILGQKFAPSLQFVAEYVDGAGIHHRLQYWREQQDKLRRTTDDQTDLMAKRGSEGEVEYYLIDHRKKVLMRIKQENLYRIGNFTSWDDLVHILSRPAGKYSLHSVDRAPGAFAGHACSWMRLSAQSGLEQDVCWSGALGIPLQIMQGSTMLWQVTSISTRRLRQEVWSVDVDGYTRVNADDDIDPSSD